MADRELEIDSQAEWGLTRPVLDAIVLAKDQDALTWLTEGGKRVAAIVPPETGEVASRARELMKILPLAEIGKIIGGS